MLVKRDSISKLAMNDPESCSMTSLANSKLFLIVNLLVVIGSKIGTKCLAILEEGVLIADKVGRRGVKLSIKGFSFLYSVSETT